jgi:hypothetical protein
MLAQVRYPDAGLLFQPLSRPLPFRELADWAQTTITWSKHSHIPFVLVPVPLTVALRLLAFLSLRADASSRGGYTAKAGTLWSCDVPISTHHLFACATVPACAGLCQHVG